MTEFQRTTLDSGITIVTERMNEVRSVTAGLWFDVGARDESDKLAGTSHFLEHLLFKGTGTRSAKDIADAFDAVGGDINAFTGKEYTCYYSRVLDDDLPMAMEILSDMVNNSTIETAEFESERKVILEEIAMHEDAPDELVHDLFYRSMWDGHPLGRPVLGYNSSIGAVTRDQVAGYWRDRYSPPNLVVAAAGHVDHDDLVARVEALFASSGGRRNLRSGTPPSPQPGVTVLKRPTEQAHIVLGTEGLPRNHDDRHALAVLDTILGGGMSSRLFQEVREKRGLAYSVFSYRSLFADAGTFGVYAGTTPQNAETVIDIVRSEIHSILNDGVSPAELKRAKGHVRGALVLSAEDPGSRMNRLGKQQLTTGEILSIDEMIEKFDAIELTDLERVAQTVFGSEAFRVTVVGPFDEDAFDRYAA
ncbi:MAG: insulinase family protein [Actinobacteria bacterium]|nr:insulinase family protein [Actinomycetota bacterium]